MTKDTTYEFRVAAENKAGVGPASDPTAPVQAKTPISKYIILFYWNPVFEIGFESTAGTLIGKSFQLNFGVISRKECIVLWTLLFSIDTSLQVELFDRA